MMWNDLVVLFLFFELLFFHRSRDNIESNCQGDNLGKTYLISDQFYQFNENFLTMSLNILKTHSEKFRHLIHLAPANVLKILRTTAVGKNIGNTTVYRLGSTCYSFWDLLHIFLHKFTWIVLSVYKLNKLGKLW